MKKLENKVAIITGAASGMGRAMALLFAEEGCKILAADIHESRLSILEKDITDKGGVVTPIVADMAKKADIDRLFEVAIKTYGSLDILINNAGVMDNFAPVGEVEDEVWERNMAINLYGPFRAMRKAIQIFLPKSRGVIINIASIGGLNGARAGAAYTTSKHALVGLTKNTGYMYAKTGIRCNAIAPGAVETNISESMDMSKITPLVNDRIMPGLALNPRTAKPNEIAEVALFLATDDSSFINGEVIVADGGWSAY